MILCPKRSKSPQDPLIRGCGQSVASPRVICATWTFEVGYFVTMRRGADGVGAAGEITNVTHVFQPSGRFSAANSL